MKKLKTLTWLLLASVGLIFFATRSAGAIAGFTASDIQNAKFHFVDAATIIGDIGGKQVTFRANPAPKPGDGIPGKDGLLNPNGGFQYFADSEDYTKPAANRLFCNNSYQMAHIKVGNGLEDNAKAQIDISPSDAYLNKNGNGQLSGTIIGTIGLNAGPNDQNCTETAPKQSTVTTASSAPVSSINGSEFSEKDIDGIKDSDLKFVDGANIELSISGKAVTFTDGHPEDTNHNFAAKDTTFCKSVDGITFNPNSNKDIEADKVPVTLALAYYDASRNVCAAKSINRNIPNPNKIAAKILEWDVDSIVTVTHTLTLDLQPGSGGLVYLKDVTDTCGGGWEVKLDAKGGDSGKLIQAGNPNGATFAECMKNPKQNRVVLVGGTKGQGAVTGAGNTDNSSCYANSSTSLEWILCPLINTLGGATEKINNLVEGQLHFKVSDNLTQPVKNAWTVIKYIATSLLVIIMLIMVFSQALSWGPFDAYTVRKVLPKLVIAVIGIQLSWEICVWLITLSNDAGEGIKQILVLSFGGTDNLTLSALLERLNEIYKVGTGVGLVALLVAAPTLLYAFLPGVLLIVFTTVISVIVALATLLFRNILIIASVMFMPIALIAWILPGTQRYWKMWSENFTKLLLLFPLIVAMIYTGRIFAWIAGDLGSTGFLDFVMVLVGFFGPYYLLPKTFKWGGSILSAANRGINDSGIIKKGRETGGRMIGQDFNNYWKGRMAREQYRPYDPKTTVQRATFRGKKLPIPVLGGRTFGRLASQHWMPTAHGRAQTLREGKTWAEERGADAEAYDRRIFELGTEHGYAIDEETGQPYFPGLEKDWPIEKRHRPMVERYDSGPYQGQVILDPKTGLPRFMEKDPGVAAAKQALVDLSSVDNAGGDMRVAKNADSQLVESSSNPEYEGNTIWFGRDKGKRVYYKQSNGRSPWEEQIAGNTNQYGAMLRSNYDLVPHVRQYKFPRSMPTDRYDDPVVAEIYEYGRDFRRLSSQDLARGIQYEDDDAGRSLFVLGKDTKLEEQATQSLGFWQRQLRIQKDKNLTSDSVRTAMGDAMVAKLKDQAKLGPAGANVFQALSGEVRGILNEMVAESAVQWRDEDTDKLRAIKLEDFVKEMQHPELASREVVNEAKRTYVTHLIDGKKGHGTGGHNPAPGISPSYDRDEPGRARPPDGRGEFMHAPDHEATVSRAIDETPHYTAGGPEAPSPVVPAETTISSVQPGAMVSPTTLSIDHEELGKVIANQMAPHIEAMGSTLRNSNEELGKTIGEQMAPHFENMNKNINESIRSGMSQLKPDQDVSLRNVIPPKEERPQQQQPTQPQTMTAGEQEQIQALRNIYRQLKEMGVRDVQSQRQFDQIRGQHPEFEDEDRREQGL